MSEKGEVVQVQAVRFERTYKATPEQLWSWLTECSKLQNWFGVDGSIEPAEGGKVWFMGGHIRGVVTRWRPGSYLAYTWNVFDEGEEESRYPESYLSFDISQEGEEVKLVLLHYPVPERFSRQTCMGWHTFLDLLEDGVGNQQSKAREEYMQRNAGIYGVDLNNLEE